MSWNRISRKTVYSTQFVKVYEDEVELESGSTIDDFSVIKFRDGVVVVVTDDQGRLIVIDEYKYAVDKTLRILPAGGVDEGLTPAEAAVKELKEETGYVGDSVDIIAEYYEYPSKLPHVTYVARIKNARPIYKTAHEHTESISNITTVEFTKESIGSFKTSVNVAALYKAHETDA